MPEAPPLVRLPGSSFGVGVVPVPGPPGPRGPAGNPLLVQDPSHPGLYLLAAGSGELTPDPEHPGLYLIGA